MTEPIRLPKIGDYFSKNGVGFYVAHIMDGGIPVSVRDFYSDDNAVPLEGSMTPEPETVNAGLANIRENAGLVKQSKGINSLERKSETAFLIGSGASLCKVQDLLPELKDHGTVFATNRAMRIFCGIEDRLDYGFFMDSRSHIFTQNRWWEDFDSSKVNGIFSFNVSNGLAKQGWKERYFFTCKPNVKEWEEEEKAQGLHHQFFGTLDSGFAGIYSLLHLVARMGFKRVILLGHDFSFVNYGFHFDERFNPKKHLKLEVKDFHPAIVEDCNGNGIISQRYLTRTAQVVTFALRFMAEHGVEVVNGTTEGLLYASWIQQKNLDSILKNNFEVKQ